MSAPGKKTPRQYLRAGKRREQLLTAAAELVGKQGWGGLGMIPLAEAAGVSRQLVYEHFENVDVLHLEVTRFLFEEAFRAVSEALERHPEDLLAAMRTGIRLMLELPRGARLALRDLTASPADPGSAVDRLRAHTKQQVTDLWVEPLRRQTGIDVREARALAWMLNVASWALFDLVDDGTLTREEAVDLFVRASLGAVSALVAES
jgi:AcrR family transcriptional regulator